MSSTLRDAGWIDRLPTDRLIGEYSVWSADLVRLADEMARIDAHADILHVDVADGHFAPAFLFFPDLVVGLRKVSDKPIHVHLMVADAVVLSQIEQFAEAGADLISLHVETPPSQRPRWTGWTLSASLPAWFCGWRRRSPRSRLICRAFRS